MVTGQSNFAFDSVKYASQLPVRAVAHFISVSILVAARIMRIRRIAIKQRFFAVISFDDFDSGRIFDLNPQKSLSNLGQVFHTSQPS